MDKNGMDAFSGLVPDAKELRRRTNEALKKLFASRIKGNFLINIMESVMDSLQRRGLSGLFKLNFDQVDVITGQFESGIYETCRDIVAIHRSNCLFDTDEERTNKEWDEKYRAKLVEDVIDQLRLRGYSAIFFRRFPFNNDIKDEFLFFPVPYRIFAISTYALSIIPKDSKHRGFYASIFNKTMAALDLFEAGLYDSCYPICRVVIELYLKFLALIGHEEALDEYKALVDIETKKKPDEELGPEFSEKWAHRKYKGQGAKIEFLHWGFVDKIEDYDGHCGERAYSHAGILNYLQARYSNKLEILEKFYGKCHPYTHGTLGYSKNFLPYYFDISIMLYLTASYTYILMCEELQISTDINGLDVIKSLDENAKLLISQNNRYNKGDIPQTQKK